MSRVNLLWFPNESCLVYGFCFVGDTALLSMNFHWEKIMADVYFCVGIVYLLSYSFLFSVLPAGRLPVSNTFRKKGQT
jgi:hypothetical protein